MLVEAERVRRVPLRFSDGLAAGPYLRGILGRRRIRAHLAVTVDDRRPHTRSVEETASLTTGSGSRGKKALQRGFVRKSLAASERGRGKRGDVHRRRVT